MNPYFLLIGRQGQPKRSRRAYARLEDIAFPNDEGGNAVMRFGLVDADDIRSIGGDLFNLDNPDQVSIAWARWREQAAQNRPLEDPFSNIRVSTLELSVKFDLATWHGAIGLPAPVIDENSERYAELMTTLQSRWYQLTLSTRRRNNGAKATVYRSFFDLGKTAYCVATVASAPVATSLSAITALNGLPVLSDTLLRNTTRKVNADLLAVYDVGQANANALLNTTRPFSHHPTLTNRVFPALYFDLGIPYGKNAGTKPADVKFCFSEKHPVILSHWHEDHLAGAFLPTAKHTPFESPWIVPEHTQSAKHTALITSILAAGGSIAVFETIPANQMFSCILPTGHRLSLTRGTGTLPNSSGIVMAVVHRAKTRRNCPRPIWLLPSDCEYRYFPKSLMDLISDFGDGEVQCVVAPHHGANLMATSKVIPGNIGFRRIIYSFGRDNSYKHARPGFCKAHHSAGWCHPLDAASNAEVETNAFDVLATNVNSHKPDSPGGAIVGWNGICPPVEPACKGAGCSVPLTKC